jgi:hypothetical protein
MQFDSLEFPQMVTLYLQSMAAHPTKNAKLIAFVKDYIALCKPVNVRFGICGIGYSSISPEMSKDEYCHGGITYPLQIKGTTAHISKYVRFPMISCDNVNGSDQCCDRTLLITTQNGRRVLRPDPFAGEW